MKNVALILGLMLLAGCKSGGDTGGQPSSAGQNRVSNNADPYGTTPPFASPTPTAPPVQSLDGTWKLLYDICGATVTNAAYVHELVIAGSNMTIVTRVGGPVGWCPTSLPSTENDVSYDASSLHTSPVSSYSYAAGCASPSSSFITGPQDSDNLYAHPNGTTLVIYSATNCGASGAPKRSYYAKQ